MKPFVTIGKSLPSPKDPLDVCRALKAQKAPFADSTEHSQWEVVAASVFAIPLLQSNDPQFTDLQHSIYW